MSSWVKGGVRRPPLKHSGGSAVSPIRPLRTAPYPLREERKDDHQISESCENLEERLKYSNTTEFERSPLQSTAVSSDEYVASEQHSAVYERIYQRLQGDGSRTRADCVVLSVNNQKRVDYPKSIGQCLQERGLTVEMLYLQADSGLTQALQDVRSDGSPLCILVEQTNVTLSSCTVIIFSPSLKIHRNMPKEQALDFVMVEFGQLTGSQRTPDPTETAARAAELTEDYMERTKLERHSVPSATRHLLFLLSEGLPLYPEELSTLAQFIHNRQDHLQASTSDADAENPPVINSLPAGLGKPPPLLPAPAGPKAPPSGPRGASAGHHMPSQDTYPKSKPPPLLSMQNLKPPSRGPMPSYGSSQAPLLPKPQPLLALPSQLGPPSPWSPLLDLPPRGFGSSRGLLPHHSLHGPPQNGPRGPRAPPPSLRSLHLGAPTGSGARPLRRLLP